MTASSPFRWPACCVVCCGFLAVVNGSAESRYGVVVPNIGRQLILERCIHCVAKQFQSRIRPKGNSALHNQPLLVVSVLDGDTIEVLHNNRAERIRLNGIGVNSEKLGRDLSHTSKCRREPCIWVGRENLPRGWLVPRLTPRLA